MSTPASEVKAAEGGKPNGKRRRFLRIFGLSVAAAAILAAAYYLIFVRGYATTDNAYVNGNLVQATALTAGTVVAVYADDTQQIAAGQTLVSLDPLDAKVALERAESALGIAVREVRGTFANTEGLDASVRARQAEVSRMRVELARAREDMKRREGLSSDGAVSAEELAHARAAVIGAESALASAQAAAAQAGQSLTANQAQIEGSVVADNPAVMRAAAEMKQAWLALKRTEVIAPVSGVVARRNAQLGARVQAGQVLASIVPLDELWVDANFKEAQLTDLRIGQPVTLEADLYGGKVEYHGKVAGLGAGTGSAFSVLPAQNATGNWIKVVQRVPVRIEIDPQELADHPLRLGLSMSVRVDTRDDRGPLLSEVANEPKYHTTAFEGIEAQADARVAEVIQANLAPTDPERVSRR